MTAEEVVVRPARGAMSARVADVMSPPSSEGEATGQLTVKWRDTEREERISLAGTLVRVREGSMAYHLAVDVAEVQRRFTAAPERVVAALLAGRGPTDIGRIEQLLKPVVRFPDRAALGEALATMSSFDGVTVTGEKRQALYTVDDRWADVYAVAPVPPPTFSGSGEGGPDSVETSAPVAEEAAAAVPSPLDELKLIGKAPDGDLMAVARHLTTLFHEGDADTVKEVLTWLAGWRRRRELPRPLLMAALTRTDDRATSAPKARTALLGTVVDSMTGEAPLGKADLASVREQVRKESFAPGSARRRLLLALAQRRDIDLSDPTWWAGLSLADLDDLAVETSGRALRSTRVREEIARPLIAKAVSGLRSRRDLAGVLALHPVLADLVDPPQLAASMARLGSQDSVMAVWQPLIERKAEREELQRTQQDLRRRLEETEGRAQQAAAVAAEADGRASRLQEVLRQTQHQAIESSTAERRQERLDAIRAAVDVVIAVEESYDARSRDELTADLVGRLARLDVDVTDRRGDRSTFDPRRHEVVGEVPPTDAPVEVVRSGYAWRSGGEVVVLVKSLITAAM